MRIITGIYKGRHFEIPRTFKARPTTDFAKENIFNVLRGYLDFDGIAALDLFAGRWSVWKPTATTHALSVSVLTK